MQQYVTILRGINVSGQKKIKMADLSALYQSLGYANVRTYIQSGNVVFGAPAGKAEKIAGDIEQGIYKAFGFEVPVIVRTHGEMSKVVRSNPFLKESGIDFSKLHVTFLDAVPDRERLREFYPAIPGQDRCQVKGAEVFLYCPGGYGKTRLSNTFLEKRLDRRATTRNWKTVNVLNEMLGEK